MAPREWLPHVLHLRVVLPAIARVNSGLSPGAVVGRVLRGLRVGNLWICMPGDFLSGGGRCTGVVTFVLGHGDLVLSLWRLWHREYWWVFRLWLVVGWVLGVWVAGMHVVVGLGLVRSGYVMIGRIWLDYGQGL